MKDYLWAVKMRGVPHGKNRMSYREIAAVLGRTEMAVRDKLDAERYRNPRGEPYRVVVTAVSLSAAQDQLRRALLAPRDLTAQICGDPLPGYSALDRRGTAWMS